MRRLRPADYRRMPWRNGGGTTTEIVIAPEGAGLTGERFLYRVSMAEVATDGPFSRFEGYDRHIMILAGAGMTLDCGREGAIDLTRPFEPRTFSGDWDVRGALVAGAVRDFNLIVDRSRATSTLRVLTLSAAEVLACEPGTVCIVHVIAGELADAAEGDTIVTEVPIDLVPRGAARLVIGRVRVGSSARRLLLLTPAEAALLRVVRASDEDHGGLGAAEVSTDEHEAMMRLCELGMVEALGEYGEAPDGEEDELEAGASSVVYRVTGRGVAMLADEPPLER